MWKTPSFSVIVIAGADPATTYLNFMKIIYLVTKSDWGGAQKYVFDLAFSLKNEYNVLVAAGEGTGELFNALKQESIRHIQLKHLKRLPSPFSALRAIQEIKNLIENERPDILHLNSTTAGFLGSIAGKLAKPKPKIIYTAHGWAFLEPRFFKKIIFFLLEAKSAWLKDRFITLSQKEKQIAKKWLCIKSDKIAIIPNGIAELDFLSREQARQKLGLNQQDEIVGTIANPYKTKGLKFLLKVMILSKKISNFQFPIFNLVIVGEGPERKRIEQIIANHKLQNKIKLLGNIPEAYKYLKAFDVFCLPSVKEGFPWVILEAMQAQIPIVATTVGALPEIIANEKEGFLVAPKNPEALKEKISFLLQNPEQAKKMAQKAKEKSALFTLEKMVEATKSVYRS